MARKKNEIHGAFFRMDFLVSDPMLDNLRDQPEFQRMLDEKQEEQDMIRSLFHTKLKEYHDREELKWINISRR